MDKNFSSVEEVLTDEQFLTWYHSRSEQEAEGEWEQWLATRPDQRPLVNEAIQFMLQLHVSEKTIANARTERALGKLNNVIDNTTVKTPVVSMRKRRNRWWMAAAAVLLIGLGVVATWQFTNAHKETFATAYGQLSRHILPDGSEVLLNANSAVKLGTVWKEGAGDREIWLNGEAFFHVKKTSARDRFIVHTDQVDVIVTGTQFNVITRNNKSSVLLTEGSVTIRSKDGKEIKMVPGDFVEIDGTQHLEKKTCNEDAILAWKDSKLFFDNTPMTDAARIISEHYGVKVTLASDEVKNETLLGIMPNDNLDILLSSLENAKGFKITKKEDEIIIAKP